MISVDLRFMQGYTKINARAAAGSGFQQLQVSDLGIEQSNSTTTTATRLAFRKRTAYYFSIVKDTLGR